MPRRNHHPLKSMEYMVQSLARSPSLVAALSRQPVSVARTNANANQMLKALRALRSAKIAARKWRAKTARTKKTVTNMFGSGAYNRSRRKGNTMLLKFKSPKEYIAYNNK